MHGSHLLSFFKFTNTRKIRYTELSSLYFSSLCKDASLPFQNVDSASLEDHQVKFLEACLPFVARLGWTREALEQGAGLSA